MDFQYFKIDVFKMYLEKNVASVETLHIDMYIYLYININRYYITAIW